MGLAMQLGPFCLMSINGKGWRKMYTFHTQHLVRQVKDCEGLVYLALIIKIYSIESIYYDV